ncbi:MULTISPECIES: helix-turn-helix transcriptional regulator [Paenibacillus]|uniref:helix-turn-helix transcriptional regulator n=1 Tax=Paenibacillus TaxID=44249 RepID=UPI0009700C47|nr:helix-turn-helix transcriptional regulator [Paenibacillus odorifer]OME55763.1 AraC family transcriptional regulator [Paenibacillus odorifer]
MTYLKINADVPVHFTAAGEFISETPWKHVERVMGNYELIIGVNETVYLSEENKQFEVGPDEALLLMPNRTHVGYRESRPGVKFYWFHFELTNEGLLLSEEEMKPEAEKIFSRTQRLWSVHDLYLPQIIKIEHSDRIHILANQILHVANSGYLTYSSVNYLLTSLLIELSEHALQPFASKLIRAQQDVTFVKITEWTRIHASEPLTVAIIADKFNYNKDYLARLFKQHTSMGPLEYIHSVRVTKAKELLTRTALSVREIATETGFTDDKYFMRLFRKYENMTPTQYRNAYHKTFMNND